MTICSRALHCTTSHRIYLQWLGNVDYQVAEKNMEAAALASYQMIEAIDRAELFKIIDFATCLIVSFLFPR